MRFLWDSKIEKESVRMMDIGTNKCLATMNQEWSEIKGWNDGCWNKQMFGNHGKIGVDRSTKAFYSQGGICQYLHYVNIVRQHDNCFRRASSSM